MKKIISALRHLFKKSSSPKIIQGYVERIEHLEIHGWAIHRHQELLTLQLRIHNTLYAVTPKWHERADVAKSLGNPDFFNAGFTITVRDCFLDEFLLARQQQQAIDVLANGVALTNHLTYPSANQQVHSSAMDAEQLAEVYFETRNYQAAVDYYQAVLNQNKTISANSLLNLIHCKKRLVPLEEVVEFLLANIKRNPQYVFLLEHLDEEITDYWLKQQSALEALAAVNDCAGLLAKMNTMATVVYKAYLFNYGCNENPISVSSCNPKRVLIVADFQIPQSADRIEQKIQHFKALGIKTTAISWQNLAQEQQQLVFHDIIIFYQVLAELSVLKAMALINASGKLSFYEIDDLESDSGNVAAKYCRLGIASTQALTDKLQSLVFDNRCLVDCDNLDSLLSHALVATQSPAQTKRKKIALVNVFFPPQAIGGATRVVSDNFDILQRDYQKEFEVCVFTSDAEQKPPHALTVYNHQGARVYRCSVLWRKYMDWQAFDDKMYALFGEFLQLEQPHLVHFHCVQRLTTSIVAAARDMQISYLVTVHDAWWISDYQFLIDDNNKIYPDGHPDPAQPCPPPAGINLSDSRARVLALKALLHDARIVLTVSESFAQLYRKNGIPQIQVNKNGLSDSVVWQTKETGYTSNVVCAHVGGMAEHKGYFLFKAAIEKLQPRHIELLIVDHGKEEDYQHKTHWGNVPVRFIGRLNQANVVDLYKQLDVLFAPSTWPESYGLVTREAAACGCWVVASTMGGIGEDVIEGQSGFLVNPNVEELTQCLKQIDEHPEQFKAVARSTNLRHVTAQVEELAVIYRKVFAC